MRIKSVCQIFGGVNLRWRRLRNTPSYYQHGLLHGFLHGLLFILVCLLPACSPVYVLRAGYEEAKILWYRKPIADILRHSTTLDAPTRDKLQTVLRVRQFAEQELGFRVGGSYSSLSELPSPPTIHVVTAAPRTRLESYTWWFPIVGSVAYKGYFDVEEAQAEARRLETEGYDTYIRTAAAFSTLGWFADPLLPHLLRYDAQTLTNIVLHELFHNTFYLSGQTAFNESLANFAGHRGAIAFFAQENGEGDALTQKVRAIWERELSVSQFLEQARQRLTALYASPLTEEEKLKQRTSLFVQLQEEFRQLPGAIPQTADFASVQLNNAVILQYLMYLQDLDMFEQFYESNNRDLRSTLERISAIAEEADEPFAAVRTQLQTAARFSRQLETAASVEK